MAAVASVGEPMVPPRTPSFSAPPPEAGLASRPAKPASGPNTFPPAKETTWRR